MIGTLSIVMMLKSFVSRNKRESLTDTPTHSILECFILCLVTVP